MTPQDPPKLSLAASHAGCWTVCKAQPGFVLRKTLEGRISRDTSTVFNVEGTKAHKVSEAILRGEAMPSFATKDMIEHGTVYANYCKDITRTQGGVGFTEQNVPLWYMAGRKGLVDFCAVTKKPVIHVVDYKYGMGVKVNPYKNKQMCIYARGVIENIVIGSGIHDVTRETPVVLVVKQPRIAGEDKEWHTTWGEILDFTEQHVSKPAAEILADPHNPSLPFAPSDDVCKFCPAESVCTARTKWMIEDVEGLKPLLDEQPPLQLELPEPDTLTEAQFAAWISNRKRIEKFLEKAHTSGMRLSNAGTTPAGLKVVQGKSLAREWRDEQEAAKLLLQKLPTSSVFKKEIITPAKAEELVKKIPDVSTKWLNLFNAAFVSGGHGAPSLVPLSDKRQAINVEPSTEFEDLTKLGFSADDFAEISDGDSDVLN